MWDGAATRGGVRTTPKPFWLFVFGLGRFGGGLVHGLEGLQGPAGGVRSDYSGERLNKGTLGEFLLESKSSHKGLIISSVGLVVC